MDEKDFNKMEKNKIIWNGLIDKVVKKGYDLGIPNIDIISLLEIIIFNLKFNLVVFSQPKLKEILEDQGEKNKQFLKDTMELD